MKLVIQITAAILLAAAIIFGAKMAFVAIAAHQLQVELEEAQARQLKIAEERKQKQLESQRAERQKKAREEAIRKEKQRQADLRRRMEAKKENAWDKYWLTHEPEDCKIYGSDRHMVDCINRKGKIRQKFNELYDSGRLVQ